MAYNFRNLVEVRPDDVQDGDAFAVKVVAVAGPNNTWFATRGPAFWASQQVADSGDVMLEEDAKMMFYVMRNSPRTYMCY